MKGCYVYFMDKDTERFIKSRIEILSPVEEKHVAVDEHSNIIEIRDKLIKNVEEAKKYNEYLPVYSLEAAAGNFGEGMAVQENGWMEGSYWKKIR